MAPNGTNPTPKMSARTKGRSDIWAKKKILHGLSRYSSIKTTWLPLIFHKSRFVNRSIVDFHLALSWPGWERAEWKSALRKLSKYELLKKTTGQPQENVKTTWRENREYRKFLGLGYCEKHKFWVWTNWKLYKLWGGNLSCPAYYM